MPQKLLKSPLRFKTSEEFVRHYFEFRKSSDSSFGYQVFSKECGLKSVSYLQMVLSGKRTLSLDCAHRIAQVAKLSSDEHEYLECLTLRDLTTAEIDRRYYEKRLQKMRKTSKGQSAQIRKVPAVVSGIDWKLMPLIAILAASPEDLTREAIAKKLKLSQQDLAFQIEALLKTGLLTEEGEFLRIHLDSVVVHDPKDRAGFQKKILGQLLKFSQNAFENSYDNSKFYSHTFTADPQRLSELHSEIRNLFSNLTSVGAQQKTTELVQVNLQCFDLFNAI